MVQKIQHRRGTAAAWTAANTLLSAGEFGVETDTLKVKVGNGSTLWNALAYIGGSGGTAVTVDADGSLVVGGTTVELVTDTDLTTALSAKADASALTGKAATDLSNVNAAGARQSLSVSRSNTLDPRDFGVIVNSPVDSGSLTANTAAFQDFVDAVVSQGALGELPSGEIRVNAKIDFAQRPSWALRGRGRVSSIIKQYAVNTPILDLGTDSASYMHSVELSDFGLQYTVAPTSAQTEANCIRHSAGIYQATFRGLSFGNGYYAMSVVSGGDVVAPWGCTFDDIQFGGTLTGGAMDWSASVNAVPGNRFGRIFAQCTSASQTMFKVRGYAWTIDTIEFLDNPNGVALMEFAAGSIVNIGALKLEIGSFVADTSLFRFSTGCKADIGHIHVGGTTLAVAASKTLTVIRTGIGGVSDGSVRVGHLMAIGTAVDGTAVVAEGAEPISIGAVSLVGGFALTNPGSSDVANRVRVDSYVNGKVSDDRGDTDYTVAVGDANTAVFQTPFTAPRTVTLPSTASALHNGLFYDLVFNGAVNGSNTAVIKAGATTLTTVTTDGTVLRFAWRRHPSGPAGWVLLRNEPLGNAARSDILPPAYLKTIVAYAAALGA